MIRLAILFLSISLQINAQELYPNSEPASTLGKNVLGVRGIWETYNENGVQRNQFSARVMYGLTKNFTLYVEPSVSNHHPQFLAGDFALHTHLGSQIITSIPNKVFGRQYPYLFGGLYIYGKYRFLSFDGNHEHLRVAAYAAYSTAHLAHDIAEPNLQGDTGGFETGAIVTGLLHRFSATITGGLIIPASYTQTHLYDTLVTTTIAYANAVEYGLSFGYLLYPKTFRDFHQPNYSAYLELHGRSYGNATVTENGEPVAIESTVLFKGNYLDADLGLQAILNSNTRIDLSVEFHLVNRSWDHFYPLYSIGLQHYFYLKKPGRQE
jgi:hypothetical protein